MLEGQTPEMILTLFVLSFIGGFCSGLLGVGGAVILIPMLLAVPPLVGAGELSMHEVSGLTMVQVLASSAMGCLAHRRSGFAHLRSILTIGIPMGVFSFAGAAASGSMAEQTLLLIFGCIVAAAFFLLLGRSPGESGESTDFKFNGMAAAASGACAGLVSGIVGAGGGFILIPIMLKILKMPVRVAVGSSLGIVFIGSLMGSVGKMLTVQVEWLYLLPVIAGSLPASVLGAYVSKRVPSGRLRQTLLLLVLLIFVKTAYDVMLSFTVRN
jgi:hypothetical protein